MSKRTPGVKFQDRLAALNRRADFLVARIDSNSPRDTGYDKQELAAIVWALEVIEENALSALEIIRNYERYGETELIPKPNTNSERSSP